MPESRNFSGMLRQRCSSTSSVYSCGASWEPSRVPSGIGVLANFDPPLLDHPADNGFKVANVRHGAMGSYLKCAGNMLHELFLLEPVAPDIHRLVNGTNMVRRPRKFKLLADPREGEAEQVHIKFDIVPNEVSLP